VKRGREDFIFFTKQALGVWLDWVCGRSSHLGRSRTSSFGLKRIVGCLGLGLGRASKCFVLRGICLRAGSRRFNFKKAIRMGIRMGFALIFGSIDSPARLGSDLSSLGSLAFVEHSSSHSEVSAPEIVLEKSLTAASLLSCSSGAFQVWLFLLSSWLCRRSWFHESSRIR
jgi:hypothetical protein